MLEVLLFCSITTIEMRLIASIFCGFIFLCIAGASEDEEPEIVHLKIPLGELNGIKDVSRDGRPFFQFVGIPYGHIPQRFMESVEVSKLEGVHDGGEFGAPCVQHGMGMEECLFINVFTPSLPTDGKPAKLPVLVFIHGGYFVAGSGDIYSPQYFMDEDVVVVTLNYRLTVFGFLNLNIEEAPGNQGMKDQVLALKWIQKNIKDFGGDETQVTIFGESAGAASVSYLVLSPLSKGLFHRAISQSGTAACTWAYNGHPEETSMRLADKLGCKGSKKEIVECLVKIDAVDLMKALPAFLRAKPENEGEGAMQAINFLPSLETREPSDKTTIFLPKSPMEMLHEMPQDGVPWIIGFNVAEGYVFTNKKLKPELLEAKSVDDMKVKLRRMGPDNFKYHHRADKDQVSDQLHQFYFGDRVGNRDNLSTLITDMMFLHCSVAAAQMYSDKGPVYFYEFEEAGGFSIVTFLVRGDQPQTPSHGDEMTFQWHFNNPFIDPETCDIPKGHKQYGFSKQFVKLWTYFAANGKPMDQWNGKPLAWNPISSPAIETQTWLHLKEDAVILPVDNDIKSRLALLTTLNVTLAY